jgi:glycosyltransferase involved in cell wall biosynthesis
MVGDTVAGRHVRQHVAILPGRYLGFDMHDALQKNIHTMQPEPLISVITSTYRAAEHLPRIIESIRAQTFDSFEWIVIDGASTDGTVDILRQSQDVVDYWLSEPDTGIYDAWNKGIRHARGMWVLFLGADDYFWAPDVLSRAAQALRAVPSECRVAYGQVAMMNQANEIVGLVGGGWDTVKRRFRSLMSLPHTALFHHRDLFQVHGEFDPAFRIAGDYELLLRELGTRDALFLPDLIIAGMSIGGVSSSPESSGKMLREMRLATRKHGRIFPGIPWVFAALRLEARQIVWRMFGEKKARWLLDQGRRMLRKSPYWTKT